MTTVRQLLVDKGDEVWSVEPETSLIDVLKLMENKDIGVVVILSQGQVAGIFSERDFAREVARQQDLPLDIPVSELMTREVYYVDPEKSIDECMALMTDRHIRHLPVMRKETLVGLVSIGDLVKEQLSEKDITIHSLENYILGQDYNR